MERVVQCFLTGLLTYLLYLVLAPFLAPLALAAILVVFAFPLHRRVRRGIAGSSRAALTSTVLLALTTVGTRQAIGVASWLQEEWVQWRELALDWVRGKSVDLASRWLSARVGRSRSRPTSRANCRSERTPRPGGPCGWSGWLAPRC